MNTEWLSPIKIPSEVDSELKDFNPVIRQILYNRGIKDSKSADLYMNPSFSMIPGVYDLYDVESAAKRLELAIDNNEKIFIHGDFDVDGITASAILWEYLYKKRGADVLPYIPSRIEEGYGLSEKSINSIIDQKADLIITVDCGIRDREIIEKYKGKVDFIITDHHEPGDKIPENVPVVHPMHPNGKYKFENISGAVVAWLLVGALESYRINNFEWKNLGWLDLVALSTVCDVMPLFNINRMFVKLGLNVLRGSDRVGIKSLVGSAGVELKNLESYHLGFVLGPRINAAGRIGDPVDALRLLTTQDYNQANHLANKLEELNKTRKKITEEMMAKVYDSIDLNDDNKLVFASGSGWEEGIIGLVAGKIQEKSNKPVIIVSRNGTDSRGSARSISGFNIVNAIENSSELLNSYGGHEMAAGFGMDESNIEKFKSEICNLANNSISDDDLVKKIQTDVEVVLDDLTWELQEQIQALEPFGYSNKTPLLWVKNCVVLESRLLGSGGNHLKLTLKSETGEFLDAIYFNANDFGKSIKNGDVIEILGSLDINEWNGKQNLQFKIVEIRDSVV